MGFEYFIAQTPTKVAINLHGKRITLFMTLTLLVWSIINSCS